MAATAPATGAREARWAHATVVAGLATLAYGVLLGGTGLGELHPMLRVVNGIVAGSVVAAYLVLAPRRADRIDVACLAALLVFLLAALLSAYPRQSLDSALGALTWTAAFFVARRLMADAPVRAALVRVLIGLSVVLTLVAAARWIPPTIEWWMLTGVTPPLDMNRSGVLWGHRHDLALLVGVLAPAWWVGRRSAFRTAAGIVFTALSAVVVLIDGSRTMWLAFAVAGMAVAVRPILRTWQPDRRAVLGTVAVVVLALVVGAVTGVVPSLVDRLLTTNTLVSRADMWGALLGVWADRPVAGAGPGSFAWLLQGTGYFDANSWAPRHPDSLPFQLLPEVGLLGVIAVAVVAVALAPGIWRAGWAPRFALVAMAVAGIGANPTEFAFLVLVGIGWAALALPNAVPMRTGQVTWARPASVALLAVIGVAFASTAGAAFAHDAARRAIAKNDPSTAEPLLSVAEQLDPGMALYPRLRGAAELLLQNLDGPTGAASALERAIKLNPSDDLAWRTLALARASDGRDPSAALAAIERAVELHRADATNLLLQLVMEQRFGGDDAQTAAEVVHAWPWIVISPEWVSRAGPITDQAVAGAVQRAMAGEPAPQSNALQAIWIAALSGDEALLDQAIEGSGLTRSLGEAYARAVTCDPAFGTYLEDAPDADRRFDEYWSLRVRMASREGFDDGDAMRALDIMTGGGAFAATDPLNRLDENGFIGLSADTWGYRRPPVTWPDLLEPLPSPDTAYHGWLSATPAADDAAAEIDALGACG